MIEIDKAVIVEALNKPTIQSNPILEVKQITLENINDGSWFNDPTAISCFKQFLESGQIGYYCYKEGVCIFRGWIFQNSNNTWVGRNFLYTLAPNEAFIAWCETAEEYRGLSAFPTFLNEILSTNPNIHFSMYIHPDNTSSLRAAKKSGFETTRKLNLWKVWKFRVVFDRFQKNGRWFFRISFGSSVKSNFISHV